MITKKSQQLRIEKIIMIIVGMFLIFAIYNTLSSEFANNPFLNQGLFNLLLGILFIAFIIEILRRLRILRF